MVRGRKPKKYDFMLQHVINISFLNIASIHEKCLLAFLYFFPVHYVLLRLLKNDVIVKDKETRQQSGVNPVWNQPFLFEIPSNDLNSYSIDLVVMRGRFYTKAGILGHVVIGPAATKTGYDHWLETTSPRSTESAKWHNILPIVKYRSMTD